MLFEALTCAVVLVCAAILAISAYFSAKLASIETERLSADLDVLRRTASSLREKGSALTALVTGANSGIGLTLAGLLAGAGVHVILACRSADRGAAALAKIRRAHPSASCELVLLDVSDPASVFSALRSGRLAPVAGALDYLFLNAGVMPVVGYRWDIVVKATLLGRLRSFLEVGRAKPAGPHFLACPREDRLPHAAGAPAVFAANTLGHYVLLRSLAPALRAAADRGRGTGRAVWTGSIAAMPGAAGHFHWPRFEPPALGGGQTSSVEATACCVGEAYGESKAAVDMVNVSGGDGGGSLTLAGLGSVD
jgi:NAD(P)-dependent dehydrogenase (short-subunit alcohol dehydrogenase family)